MVELVNRPVLPRMIGFVEIGDAGAIARIRHQFGHDAPQGKTVKPGGMSSLMTETNAFVTLALLMMSGIVSPRLV